MAHKIEGYGANRFGEYQFDVAPDENDIWQRATLVIGDERVFTESEVRAAAAAEPELPDEMPDEMWEACSSDRATMQEALRMAVRLTRDGILGRLLDPA